MPHAEHPICSIQKVVICIQDILLPFLFLAEHTEHQLPEEHSLCSDGKLGPYTQIVFLLPEEIYAEGNEMLTMSKSRALNVFEFC